MRRTGSAPSLRETRSAPTTPRPSTPASVSADGSRSPSDDDTPPNRASSAFERKLDAIGRQASALSADRAQAYLGGALCQLLDLVDTPEQLRQLLDFPPPSLLRAQPALLLGITRRLSQVCAAQPPQLGRMAAICLEACVGHESAPVVWLFLCRQLQSPALPLQAARRLTAAMQAAQQHLPDGDATAAYGEARRWMNARERDLKQLIQSVEQAAAAQDLERLLPELSLDSLGSSPPLLSALTAQCLPLLERHAELLGRIAALCLQAAKGSSLASDVWRRLSGQLLRADLPLPAARSLMSRLMAAEKDTPDDARNEFELAFERMRQREASQRDSLFSQLRHARAPDGRLTRTSSQTFLPSQKTGPL